MPEVSMRSPEIATRIAERTGHLVNPKLAGVHGSRTMNTSHVAGHSASDERFATRILNQQHQSDRMQRAG